MQLVNPHSLCRINFNAEIVRYTLLLARRCTLPTEVITPIRMRRKQVASAAASRFNRISAPSHAASDRPAPLGRSLASGSDFLPNFRPRNMSHPAGSSPSQSANSGHCPQAAVASAAPVVLGKTQAGGGLLEKWRKKLKQARH
ncbi:unnamed protein product [Protopolystoma xenopodis]|uniref:Uncharacterized protein n=1 Tax=Protopolystoma xenopodis TaxID=117903 RepID=A0A448XD41_9PLAT|nr:unnamed protein product [Protopolystoma xenopodis]